MEPPRREGLSVDSASAMNLRQLPQPPMQCGEFPYSQRLFLRFLMRRERKIDVSFSASAEDVIRRFMKVAERTMPRASLVPIINWWAEGTFTDKITGKVTKLGPSIDVGAIEPEKLMDELMVPMGDLKVVIELPENLRSADRLKLDFVDGAFVLIDN